MQPVRESVGRAWGGSRVIPKMIPAGSEGGAPIWDTITWDGKPGERSVWIVVPVMRKIQEVFNAALRGAGRCATTSPTRSR